MEVTEGKEERGEVRRIHIIYFLHQIEHPHLIRVHRLNKNGVYLRDVKRWLADLRGKDMPESFTWSYQRRYKNGYVWQDLLDDDVITPISDNEFVLKGSEIKPVINTRFGSSSYIELKDKDNQQTDNKTDSGTKSLSEIYRESPVFGSEKSTLTDDSSMLDDDYGVEKEINDSIDNSLKVNSLNKKMTENADGEIKESLKKTENGYVGIEEMTKKGVEEIEVTENMGRRSRGRTGICMPLLSTSSSRSSNLKNKTYSSGALKMFRNLMSCGAVETNDAVLVRLNPSNNGGIEDLRTTWNHHRSQPNARNSLDGTTSSNENKPEAENYNTKVVSAAYKPVRGPTCSQCGKCFKPEKMHSHMKSCKGMKDVWKNEKTTFNKQETTNSSKEELTSMYLLRN